MHFAKGCRYGECLQAEWRVCQMASAWDALVISEGDVHFLSCGFVLSSHPTVSKVQLLGSAVVLTQSSPCCIATSLPGVLPECELVLAPGIAGKAACSGCMCAFSLKPHGLSTKLASSRKQSMASYALLPAIMLFFRGVRGSGSSRPQSLHALPAYSEIHDAECQRTEARPKQQAQTQSSGSGQVPPPMSQDRVIPHQLS